jgi:NAD(P)-dependent dehydrogenase (short-subunit alcohol dehydrogenase family)
MAPQCNPYSAHATEPHKMKNKVVMITGALGVLGREFCERFAQLGAHVVALDLDGEKLRAYSAELAERHGTSAWGLACDVADPVSVDHAVSQAMTQAGRIDILINNAATKGSDVRAFFAPFEEYSLEVWRDVMAVNIDGMFLMAQRVGREMVRQQYGSVVQISSIYGLVAPDQRIYENSYYLGGAINTPAVYSASKSAVVGLTKYLSSYWADKGIRVNCVAPGGVESGQNSEFSTRYSARVPLGRMAQAQEITSAVVFLASDDASYVTGQTIAVDGGLTTW